MKESEIEAYLYEKIIGLGRRFTIVIRPSMAFWPYFGGGHNTHGGSYIMSDIFTVLEKCPRCQKQLNIVDDKSVTATEYSTRSVYNEYFECNNCGYQVSTGHICRLCAKTKPGANGKLCHLDCANRLGDYCGYTLILGECECEEEIGECIPEYEEEG